MPNLVSWTFYLNRLTALLSSLNAFVIIQTLRLQVLNASFQCIINILLDFSCVFWFLKSAFYDDKSHLLPLKASFLIKLVFNFVDISNSKLNKFAQRHDIDFCFFFNLKQWKCLMNDVLNCISVLRHVTDFVTSPMLRSQHLQLAFYFFHNPPFYIITLRGVSRIFERGGHIYWFPKKKVIRF